MPSMRYAQGCPSSSCSAKGTAVLAYRSAVIKQPIQRAPIPSNHHISLADHCHHGEDLDGQSCRYARIGQSVLRVQELRGCGYSNHDAETLRFIYLEVRLPTQISGRVRSNHSVNDPAQLSDPLANVTATTLELWAAADRLTGLVTTHT
jgi:hypothetical protein